MINFSPWCFLHGLIVQQTCRSYSNVEIEPEGDEDTSTFLFAHLGANFSIGHRTAMGSVHDFCLHLPHKLHHAACINLHEDRISFAYGAFEYLFR